jgi:hypothetical protein
MSPQADKVIGKDELPLVPGFLERGAWRRVR